VSSTSKWKRVFYELDEDGLLLMPYGKFKICTTCGTDLPKWSEDADPEHTLYHGYCSRDCASENDYGNYQI